MKIQTPTQKLMFNAKGKFRLVSLSQNLTSYISNAHPQRTEKLPSFYRDYHTGGCIATDCKNECNIETKKIGKIGGYGQVGMQHLPSRK
ncbi:hypothetical protein POPTR_011G090850v4 [Populus trichocarpa]|uniref:Uncharacterized protein n=1 Tax=Populus trichocarpa TaxID=3694 RepID=A0ACC0S8A7_POPTR|nr:hypothetical protein BDE02_11G077500 [Populus trichocarpa]KAI9385624.1 hypothetical protein POPTR_011G090850v4 [Populus trichocarpa]